MEGKALVSQRALVARINRELKDEGRQLRKARSAAMKERCEYFLMDHRQGFVVLEIGDLESFGHEWEYLKKWEQLEVQP